MGSDKRIPVTEATRDKLKGRKRGDESYDELLQRMLNGDGSPGTTDELEIEVTPELDEEAVDELVAELEDRLGDAIEGIDMDGVDDILAGQTEIQEATARMARSLETVEERTGSIDRTLDDLGGR